MSCQINITQLISARICVPLPHFTQIRVSCFGGLFSHLKTSPVCKCNDDFKRFKKKTLYQLLMEKCPKYRYKMYIG